LPECGCLNASQQAFVGLPGAACGDKAPGCINDRTSITLSPTCGLERVDNAGELLGVQAVDIQQTVSVDFED
jgi:hypothetical protein